MLMSESNSLIDRDTSGFSGGGAFGPSRTTIIPSYNPFEDPHLHEYYVRKFGVGPPGPHNSRFFGRNEADRLKLRSDDRPRRSGKRRNRDTLYKVTITTGEQKGAGTSAPAYITLKGIFNNLVRQRLTKRSGSTKKRVAFKFSPGSTHTFSLPSLELGDIQSIEIEVSESDCERSV